jgi:class 3 adenylate cyclase/tetratricopeptide (TPR) repeat protein
MSICPQCGQENPEGFRFCGACGASLEAVPARRETRKTVTVVFSDVTGSTALGERLDPESLRRIMGRYFDEMKAVVEAHGGTVEKFIGDAVMAVFGIPIVHEDDALRAVRAAAEMRDRLASLNEELERDWGVRIEVRTGVNTGQVVAGDGSGSQRFATGDAVNVAKRFEEAAPPGEILLGETTWKLVRDAVEVEALEGLSLKGKGEPVSAYRLSAIEPEAAGRARRLDSPMVGRDRESSLLGHAYERAAGERSCHLFTVLGAAGVGKSRLIAEFVGGLGESTTVVRGRCLPYGEGITFWPVLEIVRRLHGEDLGSIATSLAGDENAELIAERVAGAVGLSGPAGSSEETFWAVRKLLEAHARERPLVIVFDDVQWGEPTFLDLVEHIADLSRDAPILLVCLARPDLLDARPGWSGGKFNATSVLLEPLGEQDSAELIANLLGRAELEPEVRTRVAEAAEGNPLFVEEMLGMLIDDGLLERQNGHWLASGDLASLAVPPTIQALLSARLDRLEPSERAVVERASIEGKVFHRGAVAELAPSDVRNDVAGHLQSLVRKELLRPDQSAFVGDDAFRFRHLLIRDAAYEAMPKELRAELHERFASWLERVAGDRVLEYEEILGFHLEQAYRYRLELAPPDDAARDVGARAAERLGSAGERAFARSALSAAVSLLGRALDLLPSESRRPKMLSDLGLALSERGEFARAKSALSDAAAAAEAQNEQALAAIATMRSNWVRLIAGSGLMAETKAHVEETARTLDALGDENGLAEAYSLLGTLLTWSGSCADAALALERSATLARQVGNTKVASRSLSWLLVAAFWGPMAVPDALSLCERVLREGTSRYTEGFARIAQGALSTMAGDRELGRSMVTTGRQVLYEIGQDVVAASSRMMVARAEMVAGDFRQAEDELRVGYGTLKQMGERGFLSTVAAVLAVVLCEQGRHEEAAPYAQEARELGAADDLTTQLFWRCGQAEVLASRGEIEQARQLIQEGQVLIDGTDSTDDRAVALLSRAAVEKAADNRDGARTALDQAIGLFEAKGDIAGVGYARRLIDEL